MENEQWSSKCQQSVGTTVERTDSLNNGNVEIPMDSSESIENAGNNDPNTVNGTEAQNQENSPLIITISENSKQKIQGILEQIKTLSPLEKYVLNLKFPSEITNVVDPFRQPLNPLGSRSEIYRTISWIKTHLEEDPDTSLPKQEVYDEYHRFCDENKFKPLSQADFGKAMKQVYPNVRARRLGTRGKSRYCYSGLRRCMKLKPPVLPDLSDKPMSTEAPFTHSSYQSAWQIVKEWAKQQLSREFKSLHNLALYLLLNFSICEGTEFAYKLTQADSQIKEETNGKVDNKHREMQMQLQRKIQQKNEFNKERKRKNQSPKSDQQQQRPSGGKKARAQSAPNVTPDTTTTTSLSSMLAVTAADRGGAGSGPAPADGGGVPSSLSPPALSPSVAPGKPVCDKSLLDYTQRASLPEFNSFQRPGGGTAEHKQSPVGLGHHMPDGNGGLALIGKVPIAKLQQQPVATGGRKQSSVGAATGGCAKNPKYKAIQPKIELCDITSYNRQLVVGAGAATSVASRPPPTDDHNRSQRGKAEEGDGVIADRFKERAGSRPAEAAVDEDDGDGEDLPLPRERLNSISNIEKGEMDDYLGTNNSQHDEELSKYFSNNNTQNESTDDTKLSHLRHILQNGIIDNKSGIMDKIDLIQDDKFINQVQLPLHQNPSTVYVNQVPQTLPTAIGQARRRVSFDTRPHEEAVPPSPNTRRKLFSFMPISPGPQSPNGLQSKCSSTNASPFVSPRNTPVPRTKNNAHQNAGLSLSGKPIKIKKELTLELPDNRDNFNQLYGKDCMPMSAPPSPMLLPGLLTKGTYKPNYLKTQSLNLQPDISNEVSLLLTNQISNDLSEMSYRSQSVPINQMMSLKSSFPLDSQFIAQMPKQNDFNEVNTIQESDSQVKQIIEGFDDTQCDNNNLILCNIEMSVNNPTLPEFGLNIVNNNLDLQDYPTFNNQLQNPCPRNIVRSQSIDMISFQPKCNPSRSVPNTPLPFNQVLKPEQMSSSSRSYPSTPLNTETDTFSYNINNGDCLLNGQPIRTDELPHDLHFIQNYEINGDNNLEAPEFAVQNENSLVDDNCVLIEQSYNNIN